MGVKLIIRCLALIYFSFKCTNSLTVTKNGQDTLKSDKPGEFVKETEKAVEGVNHIRTITDKMNRFLVSNSVDGNMFCENQLDTCKDILDRYVTRCKSGDCYSLDPVNVFSVPGKFDINLPHLAQYELAKYIFDKSGARNSRWSRFTDFFKKQKSPNSLVEFNNEILRRNLTRVSSDMNNYVLLNEVLYAATIYYQKYLNSNRHHSARANRQRLTRTFFKLKHRTPIVNLVRDVVGEQTIGVSHSDLKSLMDSLALYLTVGNYRPRPKVTVAFSKMVKHAIALSLGYRKISFLMAEYLLTHPLDPNKYCKSNAEVRCKQLVASYMERCDEGDCTTMDTVDLLDPKDWMNVKLPQLAEVSLSFDLFKGSKAHEVNLLKRIFVYNRNRMTLTQFKDVLFNRNAANVTYRTKNQGMLHRYLYKAALEFVWRARGFTFKHRLGNATETMMNFMSSVAGRERVFLEVAKVRNAFLQFRNYLYRSGLNVSLPSVNKFANDTQHVMFSYLHDPHNGVLSDRYLYDWEKLKSTELNKPAQGAKPGAPKSGAPTPVKKPKKHFGNLWGLLSSNSPAKQEVKAETNEEVKEETNEELKENTNEEVNGEANEETTEEVKEDVKEELARAQADVDKAQAAIEKANADLDAKLQSAIGNLESSFSST